MSLAQDLAVARKERLKRMAAPLRTSVSSSRAETVVDTRQTRLYPVSNMMMKEALSFISPQEPTMRKVREMVAIQFGVGENDIISHRRTHKFTVPRQVVMYLCWKLTSRTAHEVGRHLGNRDHTTILHGMKVIQERLSSDDNLRASVEAVEARLMR